MRRGVFTPSTARWLLLAGVLLGLVVAGNLYHVAPAPRHPSSSAASTARAFPPREIRPPASPSLTGETQESDPPRGENAADLYKQAIGLASSLTEPEKKMLASPRDEVDAAEADALFAKIQPIMDLLRRAKKAPYCDWGLGPVSFDSNLPQLKATMELGKLALWESAYRFPTEPEEAISDLAARAHLGQSVADILIGMLVAASMNRGAIDLVRENLAGLNAQTLGTASSTLADPDFSVDIDRGMEGEIGALESLIKKLSDPESRDSTLKTMIGMTETKETTEAQIQADPEAFLAQLHWAATKESEFSAQAVLPDKDYNTWRSGVAAEMKSRPFAAMLFSTFDSTRSRLQADAIQRTMLTAGIAIIQNGPSQLAAFSDISTGRPFTYVPTSTGFELRSTAQQKGQPITMAFPAAPSP